VSTETGTECARACCCEVCGGTDPHWNVTRRGDVVTTWACDHHIAHVLTGLQRDFEVTELVVSDARKAREWAGVGRKLEAIADGS
jgi:hypothetical protein